MSGGGQPGRLSCADVQERAGEMGLGVLVGAERAAVLEHLEECSSCRAVVEDMAELGDSLLLLAPLAEPPAGFETRLLERRAAPARLGARRRRRLSVAVAGLAAALVVAAGTSLGLAFGGGSGFQVLHPAAMAANGGRFLDVAVLSEGGAQVGEAFLYAGSPSWIFMTVDGASGHGPLTCEVRTRAGATTALGSFTPSLAYRAWGATIPVRADQVRSVVLVDARHHQVATGTF